MATRWRNEISSLSQAFDFLMSSKKVGRSLSLSLVTGRSEFWFSKGEIVEARKPEFSFSTATGEPVFVKIDLTGCKFETPTPRKAPTSFQPQMPLAELPAFQALLDNGQVLRVFEDADEQENVQATSQL